MAAAARLVSASFGGSGDLKEALRSEWLSRHRIPEDFELLWNLYWRELGPLAALPASIHDLEEVLVR
ncbi:MAG TPA: hypothetical protein VGU43_04505 [Thermoplasmata archaeon]|nr:hypothetical protein [Thermoplasmata archaeon]